MWIKMRPLLLAITLAGSLTSCTPDLVEVDSINLVLAFAVDQIENKIRVSAEIVLAQGAQGGAEQKQGTEYFLAESEGRTIEQAMEKINAKVPRELFLGHNSIVVFGRQYAESGLSRSFDYLERNRNYRRNQLLLVASGQARDILKAPTIPETVNALGVRQLVDQSSDKSATLNTQQLRVIRQYLQASHSPMLTALNIGSNQQPCIAGVGVFKGDRLSDIIDTSQNVGLLLLTGPTKDIGVEVPCKTNAEADVGSRFRLLSTHLSIDPILRQGQLGFHVKLRGKAELDRACPDATVDAKGMRQMETALSKTVEQQMKSTVGLLQQRDSDAVQFGTLLFERSPQLWRKHAANWDNEFRTLPVTYDVQFHLLRTGLSTTRPDTEFTREQLPPKAGREQKVP